MRPRRLVHRGVVRAAGFLVDEARAGEAAARRRVVALAPARVRRIAAGLLVELRAPAWVDCARAPGAPLVALGGALSAAPLDRDELAALAPPAGAALLVVGGAVVVVGPDEGQPEDPAAWLDVSAFGLAEVAPLGDPLVEPATAIAGPPPVDLRRALALGPLPREAAQVAQALARGGAAGAPPPPPPPELLRRALAGVARLARAVAFLSALLSRRRGRPAAKGAVVLVARRGRTQGAWLRRLGAALQTAAARWLIRARLAPFVGRRQAEYLAQTLDMFDAGDLDRALRHAIPIAGGPGGAAGPPALTVPTPREQLGIALAQTGAASSLYLGDDLLSALRARYRRALERLAAEGRHEEAAFVLAELLGASEEAVSFLERHGRLQLAAELAEGRELAPGLVVRQWILAGNADRAVRIARRTGAFADAVARLEPAHRERAAALRLLWADHLASAGAYAAAADAAWPVEPARPLAAAWIDRGIEVGGLTGARMLARKARLAPEAFADVAARARALLDDDGAEARLAHAAFGRELLEGAPTPETRLLARACARALLPRRGEPAEKRLVERLLAAAGDPLLAADARGLAGGGAAAPDDVRLSAASSAARGANRRDRDGDLVVLGAEGDPREGDGSAGRALPWRGALFAVLDGSSGVDAQTTPSELVAREVLDELSARPVAADLLGERLGEALAAAGSALWRKVQWLDSMEVWGYRCAATVVAHAADRLWIAHVGTTRVYLFRAGQLFRVTRDHTLVEDLLASGKLTAAEAETSEYRNIITKTLGAAQAVEPDVLYVTLCRGDRLLLCTDGVHRAVDDGAIRALLARHADPRQASKALVQRARAQQGQARDPAGQAQAEDDATAVVVDFSGRGLPVALPEVDVRPVRCADAPASRVVARRAGDAGALPVLDAALLPGGRALVALGEAGVRLLSPDGRTLVHFAQPAHRLVISDHGDRALALAPRGEAHRIARIDLVGRRARAWCDARLAWFAADFDGAVWFVGAQGGAHAIDALDDGWQALFRLDTPGGGAGAVARGARACSFLAGAEVWTYELPALCMRARWQVEAREALRGAALSPRGVVAAWKAGEDGGALEAGLLEQGRPWRALPLKATRPEGDAAASDELAAFAHRSDAGCEVVVFGVARWVERARVALEGATAVRLRLQGDRLVVADDRGRLLALATDSGEVVAEWRVS
ncbi:bpX6 domain-containing protein [Sorangium sp. So ce131]|uniref:bpX6 domain-containing protein n=1 Tax=Sorangium sp. So ce131 TaxID=3133282 RepID=UPI003F629215